MFTGIVAAVGRILSTEPFVVDAGRLSLRDVEVGDSIAVQGCCLTVTGKRGRRLSFDVSRETLRVTTGLDSPGACNLEKSLAVGDRLGGHFVAGHVDGVGRVVSVAGSEYTLRAPQSLSRYIAQKGSITVDGVSLTVNRVRGTAFDVNLIPHTLKVTTLKRLKAGSKVNLEVDLVARYVARLIGRG
jgi:riboflavin synthase